MRAVRVLLGAVGAGLVVVGLVNLRDQDAGQLLSMLWWSAGAVVVHDAVLAPLTILLTLPVVRLVTGAARRPVLVGFVVWATVTIATSNVLLGVGGKPDNDTLLERPYLASWLVLSVVWWLVVAAVGALAVRRDRDRRAGPVRTGGS